MIGALRKLFATKTVKVASGPATPAVPIAKAARKAMKISYEARAAAKCNNVDAEYKPFAAYEPAPGVLPKGEKLAMDSAFDDASTWAQLSIGAMGSLESEGQRFLGYPELALLAQRPEYRAVVGTIADEMVRKWIKLTAKGEKKEDRLAELKAEMDRLKVRSCFKELAEQDGFFGRAHLYIDTGDTDKPDELKTSIGDGSDKASAAKIGKGAVKALRTVEAIWTYPTHYNSTDPLAPNWYKPKSWHVMGKEIGASRLLTFIGREVPDLLKPAYSFGGISMSQMLKPYVANWLNTRQSVADITKAFSVFVLSMDMSTIMNGEAGTDVYDRIDIFNATRDNRGVMAINKDTEDFKNVAAPITGLDKLQAQAQEHIASVARLPLVKLTGISPSGLNASSDGELRCHDDNIHAYQESLFRPNLTKVMHFIELSLWGEIDPDIGFEFEPLEEMSPKELAEINKIKAETNEICINTGQISPVEGRYTLIADPMSGFNGLDPDDAPDLLDEESDGLVVKGGTGEDALNKLFDQQAAE